MEAPDFTLKDSDENDVSLSDFRGKAVVLYFYPKDDTPGCTTQAVDFTRLEKEFASAGAMVIGISKDSCESHRKFRKKRSLSVLLLSDPDAEVQKKYGVWKPKKFMGREFLGTERSTFLIDKDGNMVKEWRAVNPDGHAAMLLEEIKKLR